MPLSAYPQGLTLQEIQQHQWFQPTGITITSAMNQLTQVIVAQNTASWQPSVQVLPQYNSLSWHQQTTSSALWSWDWQATYSPYAYATASPGVYLGPLTTPELSEERRREYRRQARLDDLAAARAKALLLEYLSDEQKVEYEEHRYFHVFGQGGRLYRIKHGSAGNVYRIGLDGNPDAKFCIHARDNVPHEDNMLAQMLLLQFDEEQFLATANQHW